MKTYTYNDVMKKAKQYGLLDSMSDADRKLTEQNPDAGMTVLQSRYDYKNATTDDARALAHTVAERTRKQYGGYSGGKDGSQFYLTEKSPDDYEAKEAPTFEDKYAQSQKDLADSILNRKDYASSYGDEQQELLNQIKDTAAYRYDPADDELYAASAKQYRREGQRAVSDALGQAATLTGGIPSTAAATAAAQAGQYYATQLSDKLPALEQAAYQRNAARQDALLQSLNALNTADQTAYERYLNDAALDYDNMELLRALRSDDYAKYRDDLAQHNTDRDFGYNQFVDDLQYHQNLESNNLTQSAYDRELAAAEEENLWNAALYAVEYFNDSSLLRKLIDRRKEQM